MEQFNDDGFLGWNYRRFIPVYARACLAGLAGAPNRRSAAQLI
jgi:hypothetical protein